MSERRTQIESAMRQAYRAGWYDRGGPTGPDVAERNVAEDRFMAKVADALTTLLDAAGADDD